LNLENSTAFGRKRMAAEIHFMMTDEGRYKRIPKAEATRRKEWGFVEGKLHRYKVLADVRCRASASYEADSLELPKGKEELGLAKAKRQVTGKHVEDEDGNTWVVTQIKGVEQQKPVWGYLPLKSGPEETQVIYLDLIVPPPRVVPGWAWYTWVALVLAVLIAALGGVYTLESKGIRTGIMPADYFNSVASAAATPAEAAAAAEPKEVDSVEDEMKSWEDGGKSAWDEDL